MVDFGKQPPHSTEQQFGQPTNFGPPGQYDQSSPYAQPGSSTEPGWTGQPTPQPGAQPGPPPSQQPGGYNGMAQPRPRFSDISPNWGWAVTAVIFFWPLGIAAVGAAGRVLPAMLDGDFGQAYSQSRTARRLGIISLCLAVAAVVVFVGVIAIAGANGAFDCAPDDYTCN